MVRAWLLGSAIVGAIVLAPGCGSNERTQLVVVVDTDMAVPAQLASVSAEVAPGSGCTQCAHEFALDGEGAVSMPFSFGVAPRDGDASRPVELEVEGRDAAGTVIVRRVVRTGFVRGRTLLLRVRLEAGCVGMLTCAAATTCIAGACGDPFVDPGSLREIAPGTELDDAGAAPVDGGRDAGDVGPRDGGHDAAIDGDAGELDGGGGDGDAGLDAGDAGPSSLPTSCAGLDGEQLIDPDGAGPGPEIAVWCEAGWTLIAKVDGVTGGLGYDATEWDDGPPATFAPARAPTVRESVLLAPYWHLPVAELSFRMWEGGTMRMADTTLVPPARTTLSAAMGAGTVGVGLDVTEWNVLVNGDAPAGTSCDTIPVLTSNARVRIGLVVGDGAGSCDPAFAWFGLGASTEMSGSCDTSTTTAGGARLCGPPPQRAEYTRFAVVFGR